MIGAFKPWHRTLAAGSALAAAFYPVASWAQATINQIPQPPPNPPVPHGPMLVYGIINWFWTALIVGLLIRESWRTRSAFPLAFIVGGMLCSLVEPVFDGNIHVLFVYPPGVHPSWHFYNVPYPWYEFAGNACLAGPVYWLYHKFRTGVGTPALWGWFFAGWAIDGIQELPGTAMGAYVYYGPQPFVVAAWPVWVGMLAGLGYALAGYAAFAMRKVMSGPGLWLAQVVLMPVVIYGCEVIAWPMWITLNGGQTLLVTHVAALVSLAFTAIAFHVLTVVYASTGRANEPAANRVAAPPLAQPYTT